MQRIGGKLGVDRLGRETCGKQRLKQHLVALLRCISSGRGAQWRYAGGTEGEHGDEEAADPPEVDRKANELHR